MLNFIKMHGLGNDFIILDRRDGSPLPPVELMQQMMNRKRGVGCDQIIPMQPPQDPQADVFMRILNAPDGSEVEACGNATRCVASLLMRETGRDEVTIQTVAGFLRCRSVDADKSLIEVDMGVPKTAWDEIPLAHECDTLAMPVEEGGIKDPVGVNIGNPHAVFFVQGDITDFPVSTLGPRFEHDPLFPRKINVEFVRILNKSTIRMRVWERDTGETDACGSAACATMVAAVRRGLVARECAVELNGGVLDIHWREGDNHLLMRGPASHVFSGVFDPA